MKVRIKKLDERAVVPSYSKKGDAGLDLTAINISKDNVGNITYHTGLAIEIPEGYVGLLFPRSSVSKKQQFLTNSVGVIDSKKISGVFKSGELLENLEVDNQQLS